MADSVVGIIVLAIGLLCCFRGQAAFRALMSVWGGLLGFCLGAAAVALVTSRPLLSGPIDWAAAVVGAVVLGASAYGFYRLGVVLALGSVGYGFGATVATSFGGASSQFSVLVGIVVAVLVSLVALIADLPTMLLIIATSVAGASATIVGVRLLNGTVTIPGLVDRALPGIADQWWWLAIWVGLAVAGIFVQTRTVRRRANSAL